MEEVLVEILSEKKRLSQEYTLLCILEYLCFNSRNMPISKYHIITKVPGIRHQRPDRISYMMETLENNGFVESIKTQNATFYKITNKGLDEYSQWIKKFLDFARTIGGKPLHSVN